MRVTRERDSESGAAYMQHGKWLIVLYALALLGWTLAAGAEVTAVPNSLIFESTTQTETISLMNNGQPLAPSSYTGHELYVGKNTYGYMFDITPSAGGLIVSPTKELKSGSYDLVINTNAGPARVTVYSPLTEDPGSLEARARAMGITIEELKQQMGVGPREIRSEIVLNLPAQYRVGQPMRIELPSEPGRTYVWKVNGVEVQRGPNATLDHTVATAGPAHVEYQELDNSGVTRRKSDATTQVLPEAPIETKVTPGSRLTLNGPPGFDSYSWTINGEQKANGPQFIHTFRVPGTSIVEVNATGAAGTRRVVYHVVVSSS